MANEDTGQLVVEERIVLDKYDGDSAEGNLVERLTIVDGVLVSHEFFNHHTEEG